jgi:anti-sigma B factor antagonist
MPRAGFVPEAGGGSVQLSVHAVSVREVTVLALDGELDLVSAPVLRQHVVAEVAGGHRWLVLDLTGLTYLDSAGIGQVVAALKRARSHDGDLQVVVPEPRVRRVFELCDLDRVLPLHRTVAEAVAAVERGLSPGRDRG